MIKTNLLKYSFVFMVIIGMIVPSYAVVSNINEGIELIMELEGGFQNNHKDKGNYIDGKLIGTNIGITPKAYKHFYGKTPTVQDMKNLTKLAASKIYKKDYLNGPNMDQISDLSIQLSVVDFGITSSPTRAIKYLQRLIGVHVDGILGENTLSAIKTHVGDLNKAYNDARRRFIKRLNNKVFQKGWLSRIDVIESATISHN